MKIQAGPEADTAHRPQGALSHCASPSHPLSIAETPGWVYQDQFSYSEQKGPCWPAWPHHSSLFLPWTCCLITEAEFTLGSHPPPELCFSPPCPPASFKSLFWLINDSHQKEAKTLGSERQRKVFGTGHLWRDLSSSACSLYWLCGFSSVSSPLWVSVMLWFMTWNILLCPISGTKLLKTLWSS